MDQKDLDFFRQYLSEALQDIFKKGEETIEDMTDTVEVYADPADRATAESDRAFTLRLRDRERKLIRKIQEAIDRIEDGSTAFAKSAAKTSVWPGSKPVRSPPCASNARPARRPRKTCGASNPRSWTPPSSVLPLLSWGALWAASALTPPIVLPQGYGPWPSLRLSVLSAHLTPSPARSCSSAATLRKGFCFSRR